MTIYCDTCIHSGLCKHEEAYLKKFEDLKRYFVQKEGSSHFSVELTCSKFAHVDQAKPVDLPDITPLWPPTPITILPYQPHPYDIHDPVYQPIITCSTKE